jgi:5-methylcytosine-specific restriction enzyme subunit McrC
MANQAEVVEGDHKSQIEIRNLYYMFLYAWGYFEGAETKDVELSESTDLINLFAKVLRNGLRILLRRGLDPGYQEVIEEARSPRGKILLGDTIKQASLLRNAAVCLFDELNPDLLHNQIIKATLKCLLQSSDLEPGLAHDLRFLTRQLEGIANIRLSDGVFHRVKLTRNTRHYGLLLKICQLLHEHLLVGEGIDNGSFHRFSNDEDKMHAIFQEFVRCFYATEQKKFNVTTPQVFWDLTNSDPLHLSHLPNMYTDIMLRSPDRTMIIDTKFYAHILRGRGNPKVQSPHLYQIFTYLSQWHQSSGNVKKPDGMLLYAKTTEKDLDLEYVISGYRLRVKTLDLNKPWQTIHDCLLELLG